MAQKIEEQKLLIEQPNKQIEAQKLLLEQQKTQIKQNIMIEKKKKGCPFNVQEKHFIFFFKSQNNNEVYSKNDIEKKDEEGDLWSIIKK